MTQNFVCVFIVVMEPLKVAQLTGGEQGVIFRKMWFVTPSSAISYVTLDKAVG